MTRLQQFQQMAIAEGFSWIALLITMVLKYQFNQVLPNKIVGLIHGILFIGYCLYLAQFFFTKQFSFGKSLILLIASFVPFGTFWAEKKVLEKSKVNLLQNSFVTKFKKVDL